MSSLPQNIPTLLVKHIPVLNMHQVQAHTLRKYLVILTASSLTAVSEYYYTTLPRGGNILPKLKKMLVHSILLLNLK